MDKNGEVDEDVMPDDLEKDDILDMYRLMRYTRMLDEKAVSLQRQGRSGTYAPCTGEEATQVGSAYALTEKDWAAPSYRESAVYLTRGFDPKDLLLYAMGFEEGAATTHESRTLPPSIPVGSHPLHAVGIAWAARIKGNEDVASIAYFGDGATSEGDVYEAMNFAGTMEAPTVFLCRNNQYAISVPRQRQTRAETLAQKGLAAGINVIQVDGNDIFAVYNATQQALETAREEGTPTLIECLTYRLSMHTTSDDPTAYRSEEEVEKHEEEDPLKRLRTYIEEQGWWSQDDEDALRDELEENIENAVDEAESVEPDPADMFTYTYTDMTPLLKQQLDEYSNLHNWDTGGGE